MKASGARSARSRKVAQARAQTQAQALRRARRQACECKYGRRYEYLVAKKSMNAMNHASISSTSASWLRVRSLGSISKTRSI
eukprot:798832-Pleurochrysis_carterae.AAC.1